MSVDLLNSSCSISVDGSTLDDSQMAQVTEVVVEQSLHLPSMFVIRMLDIGSDADRMNMALLTTLDDDTFPVGGEMDISMNSQDGSYTSLIKGEITAVEVEVAQDSIPVIVVRGYSRSHRLHRGRQSRTFQNMTDSDIATQVAQDAGLTADCDSTSTALDYVCQHNQTNWEFLRERAALHGFEVYVDDKELHFREPQKNMTMAPEQKLSEGLRSFRLTMSSANYASGVTVRAWDPKQKQAVVGEASSGRIAPDLGLGSLSDSMGTFGDATVYVVNRPVSSDEANDLAQAIYDNLEGSLVQAEGVCEGHPDIKPGNTIKIDGVGTRLSGSYYITSATHTYNPRNGYTTTFVVSGRQTNSLLELNEGPPEMFAPPSVVVGVVTNNTDDDGEGKVKVKFPWLVDNDESAWARLVTPMAGPSRGLFILPEINDEVLVAFEHGDMTRPFVIGSLWNTMDKPPKTNSEVTGDNVVNERIWKTRAGHTISLDDTNGSEKITISDKTGNNKITIESSSNKISINADGDIALDAKGKVEVTSATDVNVTAQGNAKVTTTGNTEVSATGKVSITGTSDVSISSSGNLELKGTAVTVEGSGSLSLKSSGVTTVQGSLVNIN